MCLIVNFQAINDLKKNIVFQTFDTIFFPKQKKKTKSILLDKIQTINSVRNEQMAKKQKTKSIFNISKA